MTINILLFSCALLFTPFETCVLASEKNPTPPSNKMNRKSFRHYTGGQLRKELLRRKLSEKKLTQEGICLPTNFSRNPETTTLPQLDMNTNTYNRENKGERSTDPDNIIHQQLRPFRIKGKQTLKHDKFPPPLPEPWKKKQYLLSLRNKIKSLPLRSRNEKIKSLTRQVYEVKVKGISFIGVILQTEKEKVHIKHLGDEVFKGRDFSNENFWGAFMQRTEWIKCHLSNIELSCAFFYNTLISETGLTSARLENAHFHNVGVAFSKLESADLSYSSISKGIFLNSNLRDAKFKNAILYNILFLDTFIEDADFSGATVLWNPRKYKSKEEFKAYFENMLLTKNLGTPQNMDKIIYRQHPPGLNVIGYSKFIADQQYLGKIQQLKDSTDHLSEQNKVRSSRINRLLKRIMGETLHTPQNEEITFKSIVPDESSSVAEEIPLREPKGNPSTSIQSVLSIEDQSMNNSYNPANISPVDQTETTDNTPAWRSTPYQANPSIMVIEDDDKKEEGWWVWTSIKSIMGWGPGRILPE